MYVVDDPSGTPASNKLTLARLAGFLLHDTCQGRLTLESGVPVSTSDQTAKTSVYFTPYNGNRVGLYDGTRWKLYSFTERTLALGTLTSGANYDVFLYDNAGTLTLELSAAWTNDTTRADALTTQDGVYVKSGATTRRYLGTIRTTSTTTTEDSAGGASSSVGGKRFVWNLYNQTTYHLCVFDSTDSWTYSTSAWRQARAAAGNKVEFVVGLSGVHVRATVKGLVSASGNVATGIGIDSTSANSATWWGQTATAAAPAVIAAYNANLTLGYHYLAWLEYGITSTTWYGDAGIAQLMSGLEANITG